MELALNIEVLDFQDDEKNLHHNPRNFLERRMDNCQTFSDALFVEHCRFSKENFMRILEIFEGELERGTAQLNITHT